MKNFQKNKLSAFIFIMIFALLFSCCTPPTYFYSSVVLNEKEVTIGVCERVELTAVSSDGDEVFWSSDDEDIAIVQDGVIVGMGVGEVLITAYTTHAFATCTVTVTEGTKPSAPLEKTYLAWRDEFDGTALDITKWGYQLGIRDEYHGKVGNTKYWGNNEKQYYTKDAAQVRDGNLIITATKEECEGMNYTSARILTRDLASFTYGYFEARIKLPTIQGMWPAFWMMPQPSQTTSTGNEYGGWPTSGEIDIMEARGRLPNEVGHAVHFGGSGAHQYLAGSYKTETAISEWHTYGVEWNSQGISWYVDGELSYKVTSNKYWSSASEAESAPFDKPFYILLNLAVGGNYDGGVMPPDDFTSASMYVDYVRVYQYL